MAYYTKNQNKYKIYSSTYCHGPAEKKMKSQHVKQNNRHNLKKRKEKRSEINI